MRKYILLFFIIVNFIFAKVDYSEMSTEELIAIMGYVKSENIEEFKKELDLRIPFMTETEKEEYQKNLDILKEKSENATLENK